MKKCNDCENTGLLRAWNKHHNSGFSTYSFRCHCNYGSISKYSRIPQWNKNAHSRDFIISRSPLDSPFGDYMGKKLEEPNLSGFHKVIPTPENDFDNDKVKIIQIFKEKKFSSNEMEYFKRKYNRKTLESIWHEYKETNADS